MQIRVKLFALIRDRAATSDFTLDLAADANVATAVESIRARFPATADLLPRCAFAVNQSYAPLDHVLLDRDELAVIPPVSGG